MALEIIGAGFGRTGTTSLKAALEMLGFGPCHHMREVVEAPGQLEQWEALADGGAPDWDRIFEGYVSQCDWPGARYWRELVAHYPAARVILTLRDAESWHRSMMNTIARYMTAEADHGTDKQNRLTAMCYKMLNLEIFDGRVHEAAHAMGIFEAHSDAVRAAVAPERLLVLETGAGWEPLCDFLGVAVPGEPYPRSNSTEEFLARNVEDQRPPAGTQRRRNQ